MKFLEWFFEGALWNSRFVILTAVIGSLFAGFAIFYVATVDVVYLVMHAAHYADPDMADEARKILHDSTVTHIVEVVDGYLLATVMMIFSFGLYELFISDIDQAQGSKTSSKILVIRSLDDLKSRLAKVIIMILIVTLFEQALNMKLSVPIDLLYLGGSIALIALALYLTHGGEHGLNAGKGDETEAEDAESSHKEVSS
ncbi:MAG: YqhA family protein [Nitrosomonadales bacterium]